MSKKPFPFKVCEQCCEGGGSDITVDSELSYTSTNPVQNKVVTDAIKKFEPFVVEATLTKSQIPELEGGGFNYSVSSSVTAEEVQTARIKGQSFVLRLTDENGDSTYSPVYYWLGNYGVIQWYVHYNNGLLEVAFADIIDPQGYPFWYVTYCEYASTEYTDKAVENLEPFVIEASLSETFQVTTVKDLATIREELIQAFEDGRQTVLHLTNELENLTFELYDVARPLNLAPFRLYQTLFLTSGGINSLDVTFDLLDPNNMSVVGHVNELATVEYVDTAIEQLEPFIINATLNEDGTITSDVTYDDIDEVYKQGKEIFLRISSPDGIITQSYLSVINNENALFMHQSGTHHYQIQCNINNGWLLLSGTEFAEKGYVDRQIGDIETTLENIITKYGLGGDSV